MPDEKKILIEKIKEENLKRKQEYKPSVEEQQSVTELNRLFIQDDQNRDSELKRLLNERTLTQYLDDCQKRVNGYVEPRVDADDWQFRYRNLLTRNKLLAILAKIATLRMKFKFGDRFGGGDTKKLRIFNALYNHYADLDDEDMKQFMAAWQMWVDGTSVIWDKPEKKTKKFKKVNTFDLETGDYEVVEQIIQTFCHKSHLIPLQDVWFGEIWEQNVQQQPHLWLRFELDYQTFWQDYGKLDKAKYVCPTVGNQGDVADVFYRTNEIGVNRVEILFYFNIWEDRMVILANKVPIYDGMLPYGDEYEGKHYPLAVGQNELLAPNCIYGKSGSDKLKGDQDSVDHFYRKLHDRVDLISNPPIFTEGNPDLPEKMKMKPGYPIEVDNLAGVREFAFADNSREIIQAIQVFKDSADLTSISDTAQGVAQENRTATAEAIAEAGVRQLVGLFQFFIENFLTKKAWVRAKHILQFIDIPEKAVLDEKGNVVKTEYSVFTERNVILDDGSRGDMIYRIVGNSKELSTKDQLNIKEAIAQRRGDNIQYKDLTTDYFEGLLAEVIPIPGSTTEMTPSLRKAVEIEFQKGFASFFPQIFTQNAIEFAKDYVEVYEKDVDRLIGQGQQQPQIPQMAGMGVPQPGQNTLNAPTQMAMQQESKPLKQMAPI